MRCGRSYFLAIWSSPILVIYIFRYLEYPLFAYTELMPDALNSYVPNTFATTEYAVSRLPTAVKWAYYTSATTKNWAMQLDIDTRWPWLRSSKQVQVKPLLCTWCRGFPSHYSQAVITTIRSTLCEKASGSIQNVSPRWYSKKQERPAVELSWNLHLHSRNCNFCHLSWLLKCWLNLKSYAKYLNWKTVSLASRVTKLCQAVAITFFICTGCHKNEFQALEEACDPNNE